MDKTQLEQLLSSSSSLIDVNSIVAMLIFSSIGIFYYRKGKQEGDIILIICGVILFLYGYFIYEFLHLLVVGLALTLAPWARRFFYS
jgi:pilus assembly protein TadC